MSLNPHPIVLSSASERHRAELRALAEPRQRRYAALACIRACPGWRANPGTRVLGGILALLLSAAHQG